MLDQTKTAFSLLLMCPHCDNNQLGVCNHITVFARNNFWCSKDKAATLETCHLSLQLSSMTSTRARSSAKSFIKILMAQAMPTAPTPTTVILFWGLCSSLRRFTISRSLTVAIVDLELKGAGMHGRWADRCGWHAVLDPDSGGGCSESPSAAQ